MTQGPDLHAAPLGIVGATGWLGQGLGLNLLRRGWPADRLVLLNRSGPQPAYDGFPVVWARDMADLLALCGPVVLSTRPEDFPLPGFAPGNRLLISFMAVHRIAHLAALAPEARIVRAMPNGAAPEGRSWTPWLGDVGGEDAALVRHLLSAIGDEARVETEDQIDILTALSGSGPAYPALLAQALLAAAAEAGLPPHLARPAVAAVVNGSAAGLRVEEAETVLATMQGYRGITAAGLDAAETAGFGPAVTAAIRAAVAKARASGREQ